MDIMDYLEQDDFRELPSEVRARMIAVARLKKYFRGMEMSGYMNKQDASTFIGAVKILESLAEGTFKPH